ncbi:MAG: solute:sodium symporter family transporter [Saprospiraceae bacterium]|nr:solute:sodium symporter family transporter [Saprospiraceae bacterium]
MFTWLSFIGFTALVSWIAAKRLKHDNTSSGEGYFLGGRSLTGPIIAGSLIMTNISTEHLVGMNGSSYRNGAIIITWEVTSAIALVIAALFFAPRYLKLGITTIPELLEQRFDGAIRSMVDGLLIISFTFTLLPIVLYTGAINIESLFEVSANLNITKPEGLWLTVVVVGIIGAIYAIIGGLKMVALTDSLYGIGLLIAGLAVPMLALSAIGKGDVWQGLVTVWHHAPHKFNVISSEPSIGAGARDSILPFSVLFTGMIINQIYFWAMHQSIIQRVLGATSLQEAQKGLLYTGILKLLMPLIIVLPGIICFYYFGEQYYDQPDQVYPELIKKTVPTWMTGFFIAVVAGAVLSTFNSGLNSAATLYSLGIYKKYLRKHASDQDVVRMGKTTSILLAICSIAVAPFVVNAPAGLYQLLQQLNGIFFIPMASVLLAALLFPRVSATGAKAGLIFGLFFYVVMQYVIRADLHFVHIWGLEFVLNVLLMHLVSYFHPNQKRFTIEDKGFVAIVPWKHTPWLAAFLITCTILVYIFLGHL